MVETLDLPLEVVQQSGNLHILHSSMPGRLSVPVKEGMLVPVEKPVAQASIYSGHIHTQSLLRDFELLCSHPALELLVVAAVQEISKQRASQICT